MKTISILPVAAFAGKCQETCNLDLQECLVDCITYTRTMFDALGTVLEWKVTVFSGARKTTTDFLLQT